MRYFHLSLCLIFAYTLQSQIVDSCAFLKGNYIELGINSCGVYCTDTIAAGYINPGPQPYSFIADYGKDGWDIGDPPYSGDFVGPGTPEESWGIQFNGVSYKNSMPGCIKNEIPGGIIEYFNSDDSVTVVWLGYIDSINLVDTFQSVEIKQTTTILPNKLFFITRVKVYNHSSDTLDEIYYIRNMDPDNEYFWTGDYTTVNSIDSINAEFVRAKGLSYGLFFAFASGDPESICSFGWFEIPEPISNAYNGVAPFELVGSQTEDEAIQISFFRSGIPPGDSIELVYSHVFGEDELDEAIDKTIGGPFFIDCIEPDLITIFGIGITQAKISWFETVGLSYGLIIDNVDTGSSDTISPITSPYTINDLDSCTNYKVSIMTICPDSVFTSENYLFETDCPDTTLSIINTAPPGFIIYPNPAGDLLTIKTEQLQTPFAIITLFDVLGDVVLSQTIQTSANGEAIDLSLISNGVYLISIEADNYIFNDRIIVLR